MLENILYARELWDDMSKSRLIPKIIIVGGTTVTGYVYANSNVPVVLQDENRLPTGTVFYNFEHLGNFTIWSNDTTTMEVYRSKKFNIWEYHEGNLDIHLNYDVPNVTLVPYGYARSLIFDIEVCKT